MKTSIIVGDLHLPWGCSSTLKKIYKAIQEKKPDNIIQIGDLLDLYSFSRFPKDPEVISPEKELLKGREAAEDFWGSIKKASPKSSMYQILGNHCIRPKKMALEKCPELYPLVAKSWKELFVFDGVNTVFDEKEELILDNVVYEHGFFLQPGKHLKENMKSTVFGHTHRPWIHYEKIRNDMFFELNVGYAANPASPALSYPRKRWNKWVKGYGMIENGTPHFFPLE